MECLNDEGKLPELSDMLTILVIIDMRTGRHFLRSQVGMGSRSHCLLGEFVISFRISSSVAVVKTENSGGGDGGCGWCGSLGLFAVKARRSLSILSEKKEANESASDLTEMEDGSGC
jgi:hypothetical protein